ncbi:MAG: excinuclease ABC subunit UvrC [Bacteroidales bacterium]|nr:excinuclease ABC subunit UvrC [Bacteroidales bacterium]
MIDASINPHIEQIALWLKTVPESPGVYQHLDAEGRVIYVGKARNLRSRVSSYFSHYDDKSAKIKMLVRNIAQTRVTVVATEIDALLLENSLIKQYQPRYNSMLKDDKSYPYLLITDEPFPRLLYVRKHAGLPRGQFFGPYPNGVILRQLQDIIRQLFRYRTCNTMGKRPCMKHQIGLCAAPCAGLQSREEYLQTFDNIRRILRGDFDDILASLKAEMLALADELRFEEAEAVKRRIRLLEEYQSRSTVVGANVRDVDVVSILSDERYAWVNFMRIRNGAIIYSFSNEVRKQLDETDAELLATLIPQFHQQTQSTATEVVLPIPVPDLPPDYLQQNTAPRGDRRRLLELSLRNVEAYRKQCTHQRALTAGEAAPQALKQLERLQALLSLPKPPMEIECFDNSNIQGAYPVAGMVRFSAGKPNRKEYRKFNIKGTANLQPPTSDLRINDDYASMAEVIERRYRRLRDEGQPLPDLLIVDGGEGQMEMARRVLRDQLQLPIPIAGLAKDDRHRTSRLLVFGSQNSELGGQTSDLQPPTSDLQPPTSIKTVQLKPTDPLFHLLEQIQNEVHRFAITFHKDKRSRATFRTSLTDIPGIGPQTARDLLLRFGSVKQIARLTEADLADAVGPAKAKLIFNHLNKTN